MNFLIFKESQEMKKCLSVVCSWRFDGKVFRDCIEGL